MYLFNILCILFTFNVNSWEGNHTQIDDELPAISWKECGISLRNCDESSTFEDPLVFSRVWGGGYASTGEYPWFVYYRTFQTKIIDGKPEIFESYCGGAIINEWWIITAAHCLLSTRNANLSVEVSLGALNGSGGRTTHVERIVLPTIWVEDIERQVNYEERSNGLSAHIKRLEINDGNKTLINQLIEELREFRNEFNENPTNIPGFQWDIALMKVKHKIVPEFNETHYKINSICLPKSGITNTLNESAVIMGMGNTEFKLKKGITKILDTNTCANRMTTLKDYIYVESFNTQNNSLFNSSLCRGDSGSPLHQYYKCKAVLIGIASMMQFTGGQCSSNAWFTRVSSFTQWIRSVILSKDIIVISETNNLLIVSSETNNLLIVSVITTAIIALKFCFKLFSMTLLILKTRPQKLKKYLRPFSVFMEMIWEFVMNIDINC